MNIMIREVVDKGFIRHEAVGDIRVSGEEAYILSIDASTTLTGIAIIGVDSGKPYWSIAIARSDDENKTRYKLNLKKFLVEVLANNKAIYYVEYEEPFIQYADSASVLYALAPVVEELIIENEPLFNHIKHEFVSNKKWKSAILGNRLPVGSEKEKKAVTNYIVGLYEQYQDVSQDERDATGLGIAKYMELNNLTSELESVKVRKFKYEIEFIGGEHIDDAIEHIDTLKKIPQIVKDNGMAIYNMKKGDRFDDVILKTMRNDDIVCVISFDDSVAGNLFVKYKLSSYKKYDKVYAILWRSNRKKA